MSAFFLKKIESVEKLVRNFKMMARNFYLKCSS